MSKLLDTCPICGSKTEIGYIFNPYAVDLWWSKEKKKNAWGAEQIAGSTFTFWPYNFAASRCPRCMMVFLPYGERSKEIEQEEKAEEKEKEEKQQNPTSPSFLRSY